MSASIVVNKRKMRGETNCEASLCKYGVKSIQYEEDKIDEHRLNFLEIFIVLMSNKKVSHVKPYILYGDDTSDEDPKRKHIKYTYS